MQKQLLSFFLLSISLTNAQITPTSSEKVEIALKEKDKLNNISILKNIPFENIGPSVMSGRVVDIAVNSDDPTEFYVAYASGGLWYTKNNGTTFTPVLDNAETQNIGDIAVDWKNGTIWVGTGENNASRSSYAGIGILKSTNAGVSWQNMGLKDSHHIGRIIINPKNPDEVVVGATGHLYSPNEERGIFKTIDGGKTWKKTLYINAVTGIIDVAIAPHNFNTIYATAWEKDRKAWNFSGNGTNSGIYKSTDAGETWTKISSPESGFPTGEGVGRIGLAVFDENTVYVVHDNQNRRPVDSSKNLKSKELNTMTPEQVLSLPGKTLNSFIKNNNFQEKHRAENIKQLIRSGFVKPNEIEDYLKSVNPIVFETPVIGAEVYRSNNAGKTWTKQNLDFIDDLYYSYGYYFGQISIDPSNADKVYLSGVPVIKSEDAGKTYSSISARNVHSDHHYVWVNPQMPGHLINGNDGGVNISYDDGKSWIKNNPNAVGQFYAVNIDHETPYNIYGGLQDNGVWKGPSNVTENEAWHQSGDYPWKSIMGGDGMQVQIDNRNSNIVYTGYQFGNYYRLDLENDTREYIQPKPESEDEAYRFNWQTPILLSPHNQDILYLGSNKLHRSLNKGDNWETISTDLTQGGKPGNVAYGTLTTISESPFKFGLIYTGSDDGLIQRTDDSGNSWVNIATSLPKDLWVSRVIASKHKKSRVYATLNGYRNDDFSPYIYSSEDYGKTWQSITNNVPASPVNVIIEDPVNENLLLIGTDNGLYLSFNKGALWENFQSGIPNVAVHDLVIQPDVKHLIVGTHGRSIYRTDISKLELMTPEISSKNLHIFAIDTIKHSGKWGETRNSWRKPNTPGVDITFYTNKPNVYDISILSSSGVTVSETTLEASKGFNILSYDVSFSKAGKANYLKKVKTELKTASDGKTYLPKGSYTVKVKNKYTTETINFIIE
ncbi:glycosyl hydrolase [Cellulophaga baltica]|uniref:VPS10 domain-containing protein n=1 Tax=Cellulophaga TaxID=104264 RepID=UPI001C07E766|nr:MULTISPECIES: glycoside hydrolase [Cellulophaga]MBU2997646.1 glycosyl hydrolase [Cellulophaga baltica]MDO6769041.1 glycoside hydrolase [Cellulophaga sp. 1_MG-2023]